MIKTILASLIVISQLANVVSYRDGLNTEEIPYEDQIDYIWEYVFEIIDEHEYTIHPCLVLAVVETESTYKWQVSNGTHYGLMQINPKWQTERMERLGVEDVTSNPYDNLLVGIDYLETLLVKYGDEVSALNAYNSGSPQGGRATGYANTVLDKKWRLEHEMYDRMEAW